MWLIFPNFGQNFDMRVMKERTLFLLMVLFFAGSVPGHASGWEKSIYGFLNYETIFDTREVVAAREGTVLLFPDDRNPDPDGRDLNGDASFNMMVLSTRLGGMLAGPEVFGASMQVHLEGDFLGTSRGLHHMARLRHAYLSLQWSETTLLAGQYWHPMFVAGCFPNTVSYAGGVPYHGLNRAPQLRVSRSRGGFDFLATILTHSDFPSLGPEGSSSLYIRNSRIPETLARLSYQQESLLVGAAVGYQFLRPRNVSPGGFRTTETMQGMQGNIFAVYAGSAATLKTQVNYGDNNSHLVMLGGYGESELLDPERGIYSYTGIRSVSAWADLEVGEETWTYGIFTGYAENLGAAEEITGEAWVRGGNIAYMYRVAPRLVYLSGSTSLGFELVYDLAAYGEPDGKFRFAEKEDVKNLRGVVSLKHVF